MSIRVRSRIHEFFSPSLLKELHKICRNSTISDNNMKVSIILDTLTLHGVDFVELGPGTNRLAVLIDNYVFKIALDKWGLQDNLNEFTVSQELQPYVVKTYETNELISVCEYVTVISKEEFADNKDAIRSVLAILADSYLLGDVGSVNKNFANWGYRDNGDLVILDFAYIYRVQGDELLCSKDQSILEYDENFYNLRCPTCASKYTFMDVRRKITMEQEKQENEIAKQLAYKLTEPIQEFDEKPGYSDEEDVETSSESLYINNNTNNPKEDNTMRDERDFDEVSEEETEDSYLALLESMQQNKNMIPVELDEEEDKPKEQEGSVSVIQIESETATEKSQIRVYAQTTPKAEAEVIEEATEVLEEVSEALKLVPEFQEPEAPEQVIIEAGEATVVVEDGQFVGPVNDAVVEEVFEEIKGEVMPNEESQEGEEGLGDDEEGDDPFDTIIKGIESTGAEIRLEDVDGDGHKELVIDTSFTPQPTHEDEDEEELSDEEQQYAEIMDNHEDALRAELQGDAEPCEEDGEVVFNNTVRVNDNISVENTVTVHVNNNDADALRKELALDVEGSEEPLVIQEDRIEKLAEDYAYLDDEPTDYNISRNKGNKDWK